uniref:ROK family protein n=1 Tax=Microbacterium sp. TaxID=51671 RepID=UPI002811AE4B
WAGETGEDIARDAAAGDGTARAAIERSAATVGLGLANASTLLDLEVIAISGGFSRVAEDYVDLVASALARTAVLPYAQATRVVRSALGDEGPLVGAAALVLR